MCNSRRGDLRFLGQISTWVLKHPNVDPISCSSPQLLFTRGYYRVVLAPNCAQTFPTAEIAFDCCVSSGALFCRATSKCSEGHWERKNARPAASGSPSHPKIGPASPLGEYKAAAAITQLDFSKAASFTVAVWGEQESSHGPEFKGSGPSGWEVLGLHMEFAMDSTLHSHSSFQLSVSGDL